jgi:hypothetical protein
MMNEVVIDARNGVNDIIKGKCEGGIGMKHFMLMTVTLLLAAGALFAQGFMPGGGGNANTIMLKTDKGLFALRNAVLVKYDATTLQQVGEYQIFGPAPTMPVDRTDQQAMQDYRTGLQKRQGPAVMIATKDSLLIIIGDGFGRIDMDTLKPEAKASLVPPVDPNAVPPANPVRAAAEPAPGYVLSDNTLYLMRGKEVLSINITDGTILARTALPTELQPAQNMGGRGGGGAAGAGGAGGGRAGRGGRGGGAAGAGGGGAAGGAGNGAAGGAAN